MGIAGSNMGYVINYLTHHCLQLLRCYAGAGSTDEDSSNVLQKEALSVLISSLSSSTVFLSVALSRWLLLLLQQAEEATFP